MVALVQVLHCISGLTLFPVLVMVPGTNLLTFYLMTLKYLALILCSNRFDIGVLADQEPFFSNQHLQNNHNTTIQQLTDHRSPILMLCFFFGRRNLHTNKDPFIYFRFM